MQRLRSRCAGFTLFEVLAVIVVFAASAVALLSIGREAARSVNSGLDSVKARPLAQGLAEQILADRRDSVKSFIYATTVANYADLTSAGLTRSVAITKVVAGAISGGTTAQNALAAAHCPDATKAAQCAQVVITVTRSNIKVAEVTLLLVATPDDKLV